MRYRAAISAVLMCAIFCHGALVALVAGRSVMAAAGPAAAQSAPPESVTPPSPPPGMLAPAVPGVPPRAPPQPPHGPADDNYCRLATQPAAAALAELAWARMMARAAVTGTTLDAVLIPQSPWKPPARVAPSTGTDNRRPLLAPCLVDPPG